MTRWNPRTKRVECTMTWQEARDLGYWLLSQNDSWGKDLVEAAKTGAGFVE